MRNVCSYSYACFNCGELKLHFIKSKCGLYLEVEKKHLACRVEITGPYFWNLSISWILTHYFVVLIWIKQYGGKKAKPISILLIQYAVYQVCPPLWKWPSYAFSEEMARTRGSNKRGFLLPETKARNCTPGCEKRSVSELSSSPRTVEKLTFAYLDKFFEKHPSLLAELKSRVGKEVLPLKEDSK